MNRADAIAHILGIHSAWTGEFCIGQEENRVADEETRAALLALGVDESEL